MVTNETRLEVSGSTPVELSDNKVFWDYLAKTCDGFLGIWPEEGTRTACNADRDDGGVYVCILLRIARGV